MRRLLTHQIDDQSWIMGILEPIFLVLILAIVAVLVGLL